MFEWAGIDMVIDEACGLQEGVTYYGAEKREASAPHILADGI